jgi:mRNA interferase HigB
MRIFSRSTLREFWQQHADSEHALKSWYQETERSHWRTPGEVKAEYPSASILAGNRVVFNIKGNTYRVIVKINYDYGVVWVRFIGTHAEYDKIDATKI